VESTWGRIAGLAVWMLASAHCALLPSRPGREATGGQIMKPTLVPAALLLVAVAWGAPCGAVSPVTYVGQWGSYGTQPLQFGSPNAVAVDDAGFVYVSDYLNNNVQKFTPAGGFIRRWGVGGTLPGQLNAPYGIAVDHSFKVYVVEFGNNRVSKFDSSGTYLGLWGSSGVGNGQFTNPTGIGVDDSANVYVSESRRVQKFTYSGTFLAKWGSFGTGDGQFNNANGVGVYDGRVYVVDTGNNRVQYFSTMGVFLGKWGGPGAGDGQFSQPAGAATDAAGHVYVVDTNHDRVQKFTRNGVYLGQWGSTGSDTGQFSYPFGVAVRKTTGRVYVADTFNYRIQYFDPNLAAAVGGPGSDPLRLWAEGNPVRSAARVSFVLPKGGPARLTVQDAAGRLVRELAAGTRTAGAHTVTWDLRDAGGRPVGSGAYWVRLVASGGARGIRLTVVR